MIEGNPTEENHHERSTFVRGLVQRSSGTAIASSEFATKMPRKIVQFWDNLDRLPEDVRECIETWSKAEGFERILFDKQQARDFIHQKLGLATTIVIFDSLTTEL